MYLWLLLRLHRRERGAHQRLYLGLHQPRTHQHDLDGARRASQPRERHRRRLWHHLAQTGQQPVREYGPYGYPAGAAFSLPLRQGKGEVVAFFGPSGDTQLKALGVYVPRNKEDSPVKVGPWGANIGAPRHINLRYKPNKLQSFTVCSTQSSGGRIHGFSFMYADKNGQLINVGPWGTRFSRGDAHTFPMTRGEYVNHIGGTTDDYGVTSLKLSTNLGSEYGPFGCPAGPAFSMPLPENGNGAVVAFFGRAGESLIAIGSYISVAPPGDDA